MNLAFVSSLVPAGKMHVNVEGFSFKYFCVCVFYHRVLNLTGSVGMTDEIMREGKNELPESRSLNN
jgi:hypothetical protein